MKIKNKDLVVADVYRVTNIEVEKMDLGFDCSFGHWNHDEVLHEKDVVCLNVNGMYVPIEYVKNVFQYFDVMSYKTKSGVKNPDSRFLHGSAPLSLTQDKFVKNIRPLFKYDGKISIKELHKLTKQNEEAEQNELE